jgi:pyruvate/2-oxoglutarate dehydrogenase complex dihydrolipoamide dehydrogenase (E3) component
LTEAAYDLVVLGGGSAGLTSAIMAGRIGARVLLVDKEALGGDCLHYGCVPSKALIASARLVHQLRRAPAMGIDVGAPEVDFARVMARVAEVQAAIGKGESPEALGAHGVEVAFGGGCFLDAHRLRVGAGPEASVVRAERVIIATGSRPAPPSVPGLAEVGYLDNERLFGLRSLPARLAVIGGGPIGVEMGQAFARLGAQVTLLQRADRLLPREEPEASALLERVLRREGLTVLTNATPLRARRRGEDVSLEVATAGDAAEVVADAVLVATGRRPTLDGLDLEAADVATTRRGITVDDTLATSQPHIFAVGDVNGGPQFTHWAEHEARVATRNALFAGADKRTGAALPWATFCDPEVARVGPTFAEATAKYGDGVHRHELLYDKVDRAVCDGTAEGWASVVTDGRERVIAAHIVGPHAGEAIAEWVLAIDHGLKLGDVGKAIHVYPTLGRVNRRLADEQFLAHGVSRWTTRLFGRFKGKAPEH